MTTKVQPQDRTVTVNNGLSNEMKLHYLDWGNQGAPGPTPPPRPAGPRPLLG